MEFSKCDVIYKTRFSSRENDVKKKKTSLLSLFWKSCFNTPLTSYQLNLNFKGLFVIFQEHKEYLSISLNRSRKMNHHNTENRNSDQAKIHSELN